VFLGLRWLTENVTSGSIVLTIIIFTVAMRGITIFGDIKSRKSSLKMQEIQPDLQKLQKKYANNPQKLQQAQSKLMKERGVSMLGGCLPLLLTMPVFIFFFNAFRTWGYEHMVRLLVELAETGSSELFGEFRFLWVTNIWQPDNGMKPVVMAAESFLAIPNLKNLIYFQENPAAAEVFTRLGLFVEDVKNIPAASIVEYNRLVAPITQQYAGYSNGWFVLPVLSGVTMLFSSWLTQKNQPKADTGSPGAGTGKMMMWMMPIVSFMFCLTNNAAFAVYWTISNVVSTLTNLALNKKFKKDKEKEERMAPVS
jgi:YidC/Oxa1 family membrane protein insertase